MSNSDYYDLERRVQDAIRSMEAEKLRRLLVAFVKESGTDVVRHLAARLDVK